MLEHQILMGSAIIFFAGIISGLTSFGFALIAVPLMSIFLPPKTAVLVTLLLSNVPRVFLLIQTHRMIQFKRYTPMVITGVIGTFVGSSILISINADLLRMIIGIVTIVSTIALFLQLRITIKKVKIAKMIIGFISGTFQAGVGMGGPPMVLFFANQKIKKDILRANLTFFIGVLAITSLILPLSQSLITHNILKISVWLIPSLVLGSFVGIKLAKVFSENKFRKLTLLIILISGLVAII